VAILLDVDVAEAARRVRARGRHPEPHERADLLALVRDGYEQVLKTFASVRVYRVRADGRPAQDVAAEITQIAAL
jgi:thymidylate kinase